MIGARTLLASRWAKAAGVMLAGVCALAAATSYGASGGGVLKVRVAGDRNETRVVVEMDRSAKAKLVEQAPGSGALVLAWPDVDVNADIDGTGRGLVSAWKVDEAAGAARLKLELAREAEVVRRFLLPPGDGVEVYRYVVDLKAKPGGAVFQTAKAESAPAKAAPVKTAKGAAPKAKAEAAALAKAEPVQLQQLQMISAPKDAARRKPVIAIDAGHGGKDPGAIGVHAREKEVTLAAAKLLKADLEKSGRYKVVLTREKDVFIPLEQRVRIARNAGADLFISLHADAGHDPSLKGASVYTLSENGSDRVAKRVLAKDKLIGEVKLPGADRAVNSILLDLTQRATRNQSATFAQLLLNEVDDVATLLRTSHRDGGFVVLLAPDVPAVLLEMGFMTNPDDEKALTDPATRKRVMTAVRASIDHYFSQDAKYAAK
jgi:N-acetylmuramoyl-L-alanine amidase